MNTQSPAIPVFDVLANFDLAGIPKIVLTNNSSGTLIGCMFAFDLYSPIGLPIHLGNFSPADISGPWTTYTFLEDVPSFGGAIEFGNYKLVCKVRIGSEEYYFEKNANISRPKNNDGNSSFGLGSLDYQVQCHKGKILAIDNSDYSYNGTNGQIVQRKVTMAAPADNTNIYPDPVIVEGYKNIYFDIPFNASGYVLMLDTIVSYSIGNGVTATILYRAKKSFNVICNIDLSSVLAEVSQLQNKVLCDGNSADYMKLVIIQGLLIHAIIGKMQPQSEIDVQSILNKIIDIGNFNCKSLENGSGIGTVDNCECDSCKILASLANKVSESGIYNIEIYKEATNDCNKVSLRTVLPSIVDIIGHFGFDEVPSTTIPPTTTTPQTTIPGTTTVGATTTVPATTTEPRFEAYWGWKDANSLLDDNQIRASLNKDSFPLGSYVNADYRSNNALKYLWVAIPVTEKIPTTYYANALSTGALGVDSAFSEPVITVSGGYYFIITNYKTKQTQNKVQFRY